MCCQIFVSFVALYCLTMSNLNYYSTVNAADSVVVFDILNTTYKATHHHALGYYTSKFLGGKYKPETVYLNGKGYNVSLDNDKILNFSFDGKDLIIQAQNYIVYDGRSSDIVGQELFDNAGVSRGALTNAFTNKYGISGELYCDFLHFSDLNSVIVRTKTSPIAYAGKEFNTKEELVAYLAEPMSGGCQRNAIIYRTNEGMHAQLIVYEGNKNVISVHFRNPLVNNYYLSKADNLIIYN